MSRVCIVGAGLGGLALAIRLQTAGVETVLVEAREAPGGTVTRQTVEGFVFSGGPPVLAGLDGFSRLWELAGEDMADHVTRVAVSPAMRLVWADGAVFDHVADPAEMRRQIARMAPGDLAGYEHFCTYAAELRRRLDAAPPVQSWRDAPGLARQAWQFTRFQPWRSLHSMAGHFFANERLQQAFSVHPVLWGANPLSVSSLAAAWHDEVQENGMWTVAGGLGALVDAMVALYARAGGELRLHDPVLHIHTLGDKVNAVETMSGWRERFDAVASNADLVHTYRDLLSTSQRGGEMARGLVRKRFAAGQVVVDFALEGGWPGVPHHCLLMPQRFEGLFADIHEHGVLPRDMILSLSHPSVSDPALAPAGKSVFRACVPVAHIGKLPIDWDQVGALIEKRMLAEIGRRLIPDLADRLILRRRSTPRDHALEFSAWKGSSTGLEQVHLQSGALRPPHRDAQISNLYLVGAGVQDGPTAAGVLQGAARTAALIGANLIS